MTNNDLQQMLYNAIIAKLSDCIQLMMASNAMYNCNGVKTATTIAMKDKLSDLIDEIQDMNIKEGENE